MQGLYLHLLLWFLSDSHDTRTMMIPVAMKEIRMKTQSFVVNGLKNVKKEWLLEGFWIMAPERSE